MSNTIIVLSFLALLIVLWILVAVKDFICSSGSRKNAKTNWCKMMCRTKHAGFMSNFTIRFVYEAYLELAICCLISLHMVGYNGSFMAFAQWLISVLISVILVVLPIYLLFTVGATRIREYYATGRAGCIDICCWGERAKNKNFNVDKHLSEYEKSKKSKS